MKGYTFVVQKEALPQIQITSSQPNGNCRTNDRVWGVDYGRSRLIATPDQYSALAQAKCRHAYMPLLERQ